MNKEEIKEFLWEKKGYLKEGGKRLRRVLLSKGFQTTVADCKEAIREVTQRLREYPVAPKEAFKKPRILFYDIEVSYGLARAWRPSYKYRLTYNDFVTHPKIICISYKFSDSDEVQTVQWDSNQDDKLLLEQFIPVINKADFIVAHNGDNFDLPWIRTRALVHGLEMHPKYTAVDTLKLAKSKYRFPDNKLDTIADYLGVGRKIKTDMGLWDDVILYKSRKAMDSMIEYCEQDVLVLERVYYKLIEQHLPTIHIGTLHGETKQTSPYTGKTNFEVVKKTTTKAGTIKWLMKDLDAGSFFEMSNSAYKKYCETYK